MSLIYFLKLYKIKLVMFPKTIKKEPEIVIDLSESDNDSIEYYEINNKKKENKIKKEK